MAARRLVGLLLGCWGMAAALEGALVPDGFDADRVDFQFSISEPLDFIFRFDPAVDRPLEESCEFEIRALDGACLAAGVSGAGKILNSGSEVAFRLLEPGAFRNWRRGWYDLAVKAPIGGKAFHLKFYVDAPEARRRVVFWLDSVSPEGFGRWLNRPFGDQVENLCAFPETGDSVDLLVVSHLQPLPAEKLDQLRTYVQNGGKVLLAGFNTAALDEFAALVPERSEAYAFSEEMLAEEGRKGYWVRSSVGENVRILRQSAAGTPIIARRSVGDGVVYSLAAGLKPEPFYRDFVAEILALTPELPENLPAGDGFWPGVGAKDVGRFGWLNGDRGHVVGMRPDCSFQMWENTQDRFRVDFGEARQDEAKYHTRSANWVSKTLVGSGGCFGEETIVEMGLGTPGIFFANAGRTMKLELANAAWVAIPQARDKALLTKLERGAAVDCAQMDRNWLLVWGEGDAKWAWPLLVVFNRKIETMMLEEEHTLHWSFTAPGLEVAVMPLNGIGHRRLTELREWCGRGEIPTEEVAQIDLWSRILGARIVDLEETFQVQEDARVAVRNRAEFRMIANDWGIAPLKMVPLPPLLNLYAPTGNVELPANQVDLRFGTFAGPLWGILEADSLVYRLAIPPADYPLAKTPTQVDVSDPEVAALLARMAEHLELVGWQYTPVIHLPVEQEAGNLYPERDLRRVLSDDMTEDGEMRSYVDLHRNLAGILGPLMLRPYLAEIPEYRPLVRLLDEKIKRMLIRDLEFFQYKTLILNRSEPFSGAEYPMAFISPVQLREGYRIFHDMNETIGLVLYVLNVYLEQTGDAEFIRSNVEYWDWFISYERAFHDWVWMSSGAVEWGMGNNIDMLNAAIPGWVAWYNLNRALNRPEESGFGAYLAAKAAVATGARFFLADFYNSVGFPDSLNLLPELHEMAGAESRNRQAGYLPFGFAQGYGEGWPSLWPDELNAGYLEHFYDGKEIYGHSKGAPVALLEFYRQPLLREAILRYENAYQEAVTAADARYLYTRIAGRGYVERDHEVLRRWLKRTMADPRNSTRSLGEGMADWEIPSMVIILDLLTRKE